MASFHADLYGQSPPSSGDASDEGTPDTRLTAFSPEDAVKGAGTGSQPVAANPVSAGVVPTPGAQQDPFVSSARKQKQEQKLSPTASAFLPFNLAFKVGSSVTLPSAVAGPGTANPVPGTLQYLDSVVASNQSSIAPATLDSTSFGTFSTDTGATRNIKVASIYTETDVLALINKSLDKLKQGGFVVTGKQSIKASGPTTYVRLTNIKEAAKVYTALKLDYPANLAVEYVTGKVWGNAVSPTSKDSYSAHEGQVVLSAHYPSSTALNRKEFEESVKLLLSVEGKLYAWQKVAATEAGVFRLVAEFEDCSLAARAAKRCRGLKVANVAISAELHKPDVEVNNTRFDVTPTRGSVDTSGLMAEQLGRMTINNPVTSYNQAYAGPESRFGMLAQYPAGLGARTGPNEYLGLTPFSQHANTPSMGTGMGMGMGNMYAASMSPVSPFNQGFGDFQRFGFGAMNPLGGSPQQQLLSYGYNPLAAYGQGYSPGQATGFGAGYGAGFGAGFGAGNGSRYDQQMVSAREMSPMSRFGRRPPFRSPGQMNRGRHNNNSAAGHHNHVEIDRIRQGVDVRTTVMLRNIPNKVDQAMLKEIVDESSRGKYDFMYLRIDFSNDCNVGYAFINFVDPENIIDFVVARSQQKWHRFKSDKVAEISYATIQGRDCLIQKFRNSSVMLEPEHYRPKLFFTDGHPLAGQEDEFPASDNASKLKRSCENAEHVGLFQPSQGIAMRDEQRRRRSNFDRGTSLALHDEELFDAEAEDDLHGQASFYNRY